MMGIGFSKMGFVQCVLNWNMGKSLYFCFRHGLFSCQKPPLDMEIPPRVGDKPCHMFPMKPRKKNNVSHSVNRGSCIMFIPWTILKPAWFNMFPYVFHVFPFIIVFPSANPQVRICPFFPARRPWPHWWISSHQVDAVATCAAVAMIDDIDGLKKNQPIGWMEHLPENKKVHFRLVVYLPSEKYESQLGWWHPQYMEK
jgi:hypothetical protein